MAFIDDDQVEKIGRVLPVQSRTSLVLGDGLINRKVHLPALDGLAFDLVPGGVEGSEHLVLGIVDEDISVSEIENPGFAMFASTIPSGIPELPANLKSGCSFARAG